MKKLFSILLIGLMAFAILPQQPANSAYVRIKDITHVKGVRDNQLVGYGIVTGLNKTGDNSRSTQITNQLMLQNLGTVIGQSNYIQKGSSAAVMVTAIVPPFAKNGDKIDVTVSTMADAKSLEGGVLILTHLRAPNGEVVATAQGPLSVGGASGEANGSSKRTAITTTGRIPLGAIVERDINTQIGDEDSITLSLDKTDYTMVARIAQVLSQTVSQARAIDGSSVKVIVPPNFQNDRVAFLSIIENMNVDVSKPQAKVVVNERTGTIVIGSEVKLMPAAVAHGNITVTVTTRNEVSQPGAFSGGSAVGFANSDVDITKQTGSLVKISENNTLNDLVRALNAIGVTPIDLISILQALKEAGSLQAELQII
ncbi:MAG: flagellar basal body P-ring protein FlgI [Candidatus Gastranaerophilales bacterium]|nr:flagellar basal body P-ring protein FlgI [Candidatus Gastranaerophilales bacterium]